MSIKVPYRPQETKYTCGPAVLRMVFEFFGIVKSEKWLAKKLSSDPKTGTSHQALIQLATDEGFYCYVSNNSDFFEIFHFVSSGLPVIVDFKEPSEEDGHYAVVTRVSRFFRPTIYLQDPYNGENMKFSEKEFLNRWHDPITRSRRWMMVLSKKNFEVGKQFLPKNHKRKRRANKSPRA